jgi:2-phospho-L-lactate guanylyltransferase (CobY/MobA/RfbA family)
MVDGEFLRGVPGVLVIPGDLGLIESKDVDRMVGISHGLRRIVLAKALSDGGTNALLVPFGRLVGPYFGPDSFQRHLQAARRAKMSVRVAPISGASFDLDTPDDLDVYRKHHPDLEETLARWRARIRSSGRLSTSREKLQVLPSNAS